MKRNIEKHIHELRSFDFWNRLLGLLIVDEVVVIIAILIYDLTCNAQEVEPSFTYTESIPFEEQIEHDEEVIYEKWLESAEPLSHDIEAVEEETHYVIEVTDEDIDLMARVVMSEASILPQDAKQAIATTIVNRVRDDKNEFRNENTVTDVVYHGNAYSTSDNGEVAETCYQAVYAALTYDNAFPSEMVYFREDRYHSFGVPYSNIGTTYFSCFEGYKNE